MPAPAPTGFRPIALRVLQERYLRRDPDGRVVETPDELFLPGGPGGGRGRSALRRPGGSGPPDRGLS